jgi:glycosyltransferase involved in cell wall biosynthesis
MAIRSVLVCEAQVPLVEGGAEHLVRQLVERLRRHGYLAGRVAIPFRWYPKEEILAHAAAWRLLNLSESNSREVDLVIGTKFPSYFVRHPNKVAWLIHQYRPAYDLCGTPYGDFDHTELDVGLRETLLRLDRRMLSECRRLFTIARNTAARLEKYNGMSAEALYHPPRLAERMRPGEYGSYVLSVGRLEAGKRVDLIVRALPLIDGPVRLVVVGEGTSRQHLDALSDRLGVADRVTFTGPVEDETLLELYAGALAVVYPPYDEDFGYVTLEAFLARKPVVTTTDSGVPLEFVEDGLNGFVVPPEPEAVAQAVNRLADKRSLAASFGGAGWERARQITWDGVVERLVGGHTG